MRIRTIKPGFWKSEQVLAVPIEARLIFIGLWSMADVMGRLEDRVLKIRRELLSEEDKVDVNECLDRLQEVGLILRYQTWEPPGTDGEETGKQTGSKGEVDGKMAFGGIGFDSAPEGGEDKEPPMIGSGGRYIQILKFGVHQRPSGKEATSESEIPIPPLDVVAALWRRMREHVRPTFLASRRYATQAESAGEVKGKQGGSKGEARGNAGVMEEGGRKKEEKREDGETAGASPGVGGKWGMWVQRFRKVHTLCRNVPEDAIVAEIRNALAQAPKADIDEALAAFERQMAGVVSVFVPLRELGKYLGRSVREAGGGPVGEDKEPARQTFQGFGGGQ